MLADPAIREQVRRALEDGTSGAELARQLGVSRVYGNKLLRLMRVLALLTPASC
jgi:hypothetical protein